MKRSAFSPHPPQAVPLPLKGKDKTRSLRGARLSLSGAWGYRRPHPPQAIPLLLRGEGLKARESGRDFPVGRMLPFAQAGGAKPIAARDTNADHLVGWVGGVYPSALLPARTAASDGQRAFTRAARSAGLRFAVRSLSGAIDREINKVRRPGWHLIHRYRGPPSPRRGRLKCGPRWA